MLTVMLSIPAEAPRAALEAACSVLDRPVLRLLIDALPLVTSISSTISNLLGAGIPPAVQWIRDETNEKGFG